VSRGVPRSAYTIQLVCISFIYDSLYRMKVTIYRDTPLICAIYQRLDVSRCLGGVPDTMGHAETYFLWTRGFQGRHGFGQIEQPEFGHRLRGHLPI
jgi:hypothetical protein